jgi:colanic acid/amylovoran biosynthesis glycosyltransferase
MQKLKVLHFVECWLPLTENWLFNHISALPEEVDSHVVCQWTNNLDAFPFRQLQSANQPPTQTSLLGRALRRANLWDDRERHLPLLRKTIQEVKPDILHSHFGHYGWINSKILRRMSIPHVVSFYGFDVGYLPHTDPKWVARYRSMSTKVDLILCEGPFMAHSMSMVGVNSTKIKILRLGIDLEKAPFRPRTNPIGRELRFLIAGSFREKKGIPYAIEALGLFSKVHPNFEITVVGAAGTELRGQREKESIIAQTKKYGLESKIRFMGYQSHDSLRSQFYSNDIFVSPSVTARDGDSEGGAPVSIIEAAASGMPIVSTQHCDIPYILSEMNEPFLAPERDPVRLCDAIIKLVALKDWMPLLTANRELIERELELGKQGQKLAKIYAQVASRDSHRNIRHGLSDQVPNNLEERVAASSIRTH